MNRVNFWESLRLFYLKDDQIFAQEIEEVAWGIVEGEVKLVASDCLELLEKESVPQGKLAVRGA